jgi:hypothetical protein
VDGQGRIKATALPRLSGPAIVCIQAGNVNTGAFDPAPALCDWAAAHGAWVHVDGAFGLWARATPRLAAHANGFERADSWAIDAHKWLNVPYDCGMALVRDESALRAAMAMSAAYRRHPAFAIDALLARRIAAARAVDVWAALAFLVKGWPRWWTAAAGTRPACGDSKRPATRCWRDDLEPGARGVGDLRTRQVIAAVQEDGVCCGGTAWQGREACRSACRRGPRPTTTSNDRWRRSSRARAAAEDGVATTTALGRPRSAATPPRRGDGGRSRRTPCDGGRDEFARSWMHSNSTASWRTAAYRRRRYAFTRCGNELRGFPPTALPDKKASRRTGHRPLVCTGGRGHRPPSRAPAAVGDVRARSPPPRACRQ